MQGPLEATFGERCHRLGLLLRQPLQLGEASGQKRLRQRGKRIADAPAAQRGQQAVRGGGHQHQGRVCRRLLQRLQKGVLGGGIHRLRGQHQNHFGRRLEASQRQSLLELSHLLHSDVARGDVGKVAPSGEAASHLFLLGQKPEDVGVGEALDSGAGRAPSAALPRSLSGTPGPGPGLPPSAPCRPRTGR